MKKKTKKYLKLLTLGVFVQVVLSLLGYEVIPKNFFFENDFLNKNIQFMILFSITFYVVYFYDYKHDRVLFKQKEIGKKE